MNSEIFSELCRADNKQLEDLFRVAKAPDFQRLAGFEWRGVNTSTLPRLLGLQKFIKGFFYDGDRPSGYNVRVRQNGLDADWIEISSGGKSRRFGYYLVCPVGAAGPDNHYPDALLLDYAASPRNPRLRVERRLRDYLVQPYPDHPDVLLGKAYLAFGSARLPSNFFVLERIGPAPDSPAA